MKVIGDEFEGNNNQGGDDIIIINDSSGSSIIMGEYGNIIAGNDTIIVENSTLKGSVYADADYSTDFNDYNAAKGDLGVRVSW